MYGYELPGDPGVPRERLSAPAPSPPSPRMAALLAGGWQEAQVIRLCRWASGYQARAYDGIDAATGRRLSFARWLAVEGRING
jgi:hypothetical protein